MNSTTTLVSANATIQQSAPLQTLVIQMINICEAFGMIVGNGSIIVTILFTKNLRRKELFFLVGLALSDFVDGIGCVVYYIKSFTSTLNPTGQVYMSAWMCMQQFHTILVVLGSQISPLMHVVISVDRLIAVVWFQTYVVLTKSYAYKVLLAVGTYTIVTAVTAVLSSYFQTDHNAFPYPSSCPPVYSVAQWYGSYYIPGAAFCTTLSVVIYVAIIIAHKWRSPISQNQSVQNAQLKRQQKLTKTLGIVSLCTLFFHSIPMCIGAYFRVSGDTSSVIYTTIIPYTSIFVALYSVVNVFIFFSRHRDMRVGLRKLIRTVLSARIKKKVHVHDSVPNS